MVIAVPGRIEPDVQGALGSDDVQRVQTEVGVVGDDGDSPAGCSVEMARFAPDWRVS